MIRPLSRQERQMTTDVMAREAPPLGTSGSYSRGGLGPVSAFCLQTPGDAAAATSTITAAAAAIHCAAAAATAAIHCAAAASAAAAAAAATAAAAAAAAGV